MGGYPERVAGIYPARDGLNISMASAASRQHGSPISKSKYVIAISCMARIRQMGAQLSVRMADNVVGRDGERHLQVTGTFAAKGIGR